MNLTTAKRLAKTQLAEHGLGGWRFRFDHARARFGLCDYTHKTISMSKALTKLNTEAAFMDTLLHEIAHALVGHQYNHGSVWQNKALSIGCNGERAYSPNNVVTPKGRYVYACPRCGHERNRYKRTTVKKSCRACCDNYNGGGFSDEFVMVLKTEAM